MGALLIDVFENNDIYTLIKCFFYWSRNLFQFVFEVYVTLYTLYPTADRIGCIYSI